MIPLADHPIFSDHGYMSPDYYEIGELAREYFPRLDPTYFLEVLKMWSDDRRKWHAIGHLREMLRHTEHPTVIVSFKDDPIMLELLRYAALYHDAIMDFTSKTNEEESAYLAYKHLANLPCLQRNTVVGMILATKDPRYVKAECERLFVEWDRKILRSTDWGKLLRYEHMIRGEYAGVVNTQEYEQKRWEFLVKASQDYSNPLLRDLAHYVVNPRLRSVIGTGYASGIRPS